MSNNATLLGYCCFLMMQILSRCLILWTIQQNYLMQMIHVERMSRKFLIDCLIEDKIDELQRNEDLFQNLEYVFDSCLIRFETDDTTIKVFMTGDFIENRIVERDKESGSGIE